jgi:predicted NAD/FAD-dependent oxidoreductase
MATRLQETEGLVARVDSGAQFFTARSHRLQALVARWLEEGWLEVWSHGFPLWRHGAIIARDPGHPRYAPPMGMNEVARHLARDLDVLCHQTIVRLERGNDSYTALTAAGTAFSGRTLILSLPPVQLLNLAHNLLLEDMKEQIASVEFQPAWTLLAMLKTDLTAVDWPAVEFENHPILGWVARDHTKRRPTAIPTLVTHSSGEWSRTHLDDSPESVQTAILGALEDVLGPVPIQMVQVHRWHYALPSKTVAKLYLWDETRRIGCCGDWCAGPRVEGALLSGWGLAQAMIG